MEYKDYYKALGVAADAPLDEIKRAYRTLARKYHPDISKEPGAEERFKEISEAYEALKDPEKRAAYDQLGRDFQAGQQFRPPPGWDAGFEHREHYAETDTSEFSDFFEALFGRARAGSRGRAGTQGGFQARGGDHQARVLIDLEDAYGGATRALTLRAAELGEDGRVRMKERTLNVRIPKGVREGQLIRLAGQGDPGYGGGPPGDLYLEVAFNPHARYRVEGADVYLDLPVTPWEAALGAKVKTPTPSGAVDLAVPAGSRQGRRLRLKGRGIPGDPPGDLFVVLQIALPPADSDAARAAYRALAEAAPFNPRRHLEV
ncbi:MAG: DnaJ C-terminal domain-containing protein [Alphaproteobacteria bacterium]